MALKHVLKVLLCATLLAWSGLSLAQEYRPDEFLTLDLVKAVLSKKPLGPAAQFEPFPVQARSERAQARVEPKAAARVAAPRIRVAQPRLEQPRHAHAKLAHRGNPLDAQARDTRIQVWPCRTGGICDWKR